MSRKILGLRRLRGDFSAGSPNIRRGSLVARVRFFRYAEIRLTMIGHPLGEVTS